MKSIKEKAEEYGKDWYKINGSLLDRCRGCYAHVSSSYEAGATYVLEKFVDIVNKNTKPNGMEDRAKIANDMLILIEQLKK